MNAHVTVTDDLQNVVFQLLHAEVRDASPPTVALDDDDDIDYEELADRETPAVRAVGFLYGVTDTGHSLVVKVSGFKPGFYVKLSDGATAEHAAEAGRQVEMACRLKPRTVKSTLLTKPEMYGWTSDPADPLKRKRFSWARLEFETCKAARGATYTLEKHCVDPGDRDGLRLLAMGSQKVDVTQQMLAACGVRASGWAQLNTFSPAPASSRMAPFVQLEMATALSQVVPRDDLSVVSRIVFTCTDIETDSATGAMSHAVCTPKCPAGCKGDAVIFIGISVWAYSSAFQPVARYMLCLGDVAPVPDVTVKCYKTELELLLAWRDHIVRIDSDWEVSYNGSGFDYKYLSDRYLRLKRGGYTRFLHLGKLVADTCPIQEKRLQSNAYGDNTLSTFQMKGRVVSDLFLYAKVNFKMTSYKLDAMAKAYIPDTTGKVVLALPGWVEASMAAVRRELLGAGLPPDHEAMLALDLPAPLTVAVEESGSLIVLEEDVGDEVDEDKEHPYNALLRKSAALLTAVQSTLALKDAFRMALTATGSDNYKKLHAINRMDAVARSAIARYAMVDCDLTLHLMHAVSAVPNMVQMSCVTHTLLTDIANRGQQIKVYNQLYRFGADFVMNAPCSGWPEGCEYEGAHVIPPVPGFYQDPVVVLDFASLYPSIMQAKNLCFSTLCITSSPPALRVDDYEISGRAYRFQRHERGVMPQILDGLLDARKATKTAMKGLSKSSLEYALLDGKQLALKVSANSCYGFLGVQTNGMYACVPAAAAVTMNGRGMIKRTQEFVMSQGATVIYGDSVSGDTALIVRDSNTGLIGTRRIDELGDPAVEWAAYHDTKEEYAGPKSWDVWSDTGFTRVRKIIRHAHLNPLHRVLTHTGVVDCTADHSLLRPDGTEVRPCDVQLGSELMHASLPTLACDAECGITLGHAFGMGLFAADGSCGEYMCPSGVKRTWAINNADIELLKRVQLELPFETKIDDTLISSGVYKLAARGDVKSVVQQYRSLFYNAHREKRIPECILNAPLDVAQAFFDGFYAGDGDRAGKVRQPNSWTIDQKGKEVCTGLWLLGVKLGFKLRINSRADKLNVFTLGLTKTVLRKNPVGIKKLFIHSDGGAAAGVSHQVCAEYYSNPGFVYDLETDNHHFHVGPGRMIVHNTDSIMFTLPGVSRDDVFIKGPELAKGASALFEKPIKLEFEKVMEQYMLLKKKNYAGIMRTCLEDKGKLMAKGIASERRDNCELVRTTIKKVLGAVMVDRDPTKAFTIVKAVLDSLMRNEIPIQDLGITMSLKPEDSYVDPNGHAQLNVVRKMIARGAFNVPRAGDRVEYVIVESSADKVSDRAEDPVYVVKNSVKLDRLYYLNNQLRTPILKIMEVLPVPSVKKLFATAEADLERQRLGVGRVTDFFVPTATTDSMPPRSYTMKNGVTPPPLKKQKRELVQTNLTFT